ncbi:flagellar hook protein FlgE [Halomonas elongata]|uniref:Flagellar hook protein FlgE n=1 Tax=Halomonas elongata (strain ATCC 33173 / DSM 2581 / NBRC 15536 / NCIMB 2198 / 1H9) TaxID=768066 RepID=E1VC92_HALED|nr:flagellar hook protein FlgE [Halomonas elongata]WBF18027.1 flagellar hook protein FlgE [Halomonas elongata]WPU46877.1 flagellar hook protein FlgE [Halomonas elongata DSM 2581]CBV44262.1 flagellar hook protein FlgE [Halomonas elongata DSM 2581]
MGFSQALSGLNAASSSLDVLGNNIANSQTVGFKGSDTLFADVYANSKVGLGTKVSRVLQDFGEGNLESTGRNLDLGISGEGFLRFQQNGEVVYSRNGQLSMTADGYLENAQGARLMGFGVNDAGQVQTGGQPSVLQVSAEEMAASATTDVATTLNLDSREAVGEQLDQVDVTTDMSDPANNQQTLDYHYANNFTAYDSLGNPRNATVYYQKTGANSWTGRVTMDGHYDASNDFTLTFNNSGQLATINGNDAGDPANMPTVSVASDNTTPLGGEPAELSFTLDIAGSTQFGNTSRASDLIQDGYTSGSLVGISIEDDGTIVRNYTNEQSRPAGQVSLASFRNPEGLDPVGDNAWAATAASGQELVGAPGTGQLGGIQSGVVESSNVDMAQELVDMIVTQRAYQANSQTIKTQDEVLQTAINLR